MDNPNNDDNLNKYNKKEYLGSRYSEQLFGDKGGSTTDSSNEEMAKKEEKTRKMFWKATGEEDYTKEETISNRIFSFYFF